MVFFGAAGYAPDRCPAQYNAAGGDIHAPRRAQYDENKDKINAQKRAAYKGRVERKQAETLENKPGSDIMEPHRKSGGENGVHAVGKIDPQIYQCITPDISTTEVIITDERIQHIKERHPNDYEQYAQYMKEMVEHPQYILQGNKPNSALILCSFDDSRRNYKLLLRIKTSGDPGEYKNSIIHFQKVEDKRYNRYIKSDKVLYKRE